MKTLKITLDDTPQAHLLVDMLRGLSFVRDVKDESISPSEDSVLDVIRKEGSDRRERIRKHLLSAPTLSEDELASYAENRKYLNQWRTQ